MTNHLTALFIASAGLYAGPAVTSIGPEGGTFLSLLADPRNPGTLYAGARNSGVFKTTDGGAHWTNSGLAGLTVGPLVFDSGSPASLYAVTSAYNSDGDAVSFGFFRSVDGANTWEPVDSGASLPCGVGALAADPQRPATLYGIGCNGVVRTTDGGRSWQPASSGLPDRGPGAGLTQIVIDSQNSFLYLASYRCDLRPGPTPACESRVFRSADRADNWIEITTTPLAPYMVWGLAIDPQNPTTLYARVFYGNAQNALIKSVDGGATWSQVNLALSMGCCVGLLTIDAHGTIYTASLAGLFKSIDAGASWSAISFFRGPTGISALVFDPQDANTVYVADTSRVVKTTDGGDDWQPANHGLRAAGVSTVAADPNRPGILYAGALAGFAALGGGVSTSHDGGATWSAASPLSQLNDSVYALIIDPTNPDTIYAATGGRDDYATDAGGVFKSADGGANWVAASSGLSNSGAMTALALDPQQPTTLYAGNWGGGVFKSTDGAATWNAMNSGLPGGASGPLVMALLADPSNSGTVYVAIWSTAPMAPPVPRLFKSTDGALTWNSLPADFGPIPDQCCLSISSIVIDPQNTTVLYAGTTGPGGALWKSIDGGTSWEKKLSSPCASIAVNPQDSAIVYAGTDSGVSVSLDGGESWTVAPGTPASAGFLVNDPLNPDTLYAASLGGLFAIDFSGSR
jgi:photosystem II stability/assembly factor-like uncharacterized protein